MWPLSVTSFRLSRRSAAIALWLGVSLILHAGLSAWIGWRAIVVDTADTPTDPAPIQAQIAPTSPPPVAPAAPLVAPRPIRRAIPAAPVTPAPEANAGVSTLVAPEPTALLETAPKSSDADVTSLPETVPNPTPPLLSPGDLAVNRYPPSAQLQYDVQFKRRDEIIHGSGTLFWHNDGQRYRLEITARAIIQVSRQTSVGEWLPNAGLTPRTHTDQRGLRGTSQVQFLWQQTPPQIQFSQRPEPQPWQAGMQDYVSLIMQLASVLASNPSNFYVGTGVRFDVADTRRSREMIFRLGEAQTIATGLGSMQAWPFRYEAPAGLADRNIAIWYAREADWLPVKLRFVDPARGEVLELTLQQRSNATEIETPTAFDR